MHSKIGQGTGQTTPLTMLSEKSGRDVALFTQPVRQIVAMLVVIALVASGAWVIHSAVEGIFLTNPWLNGFILFVFLRFRICVATIVIIATAAATAAATVVLIGCSS